jgi:hypothetical protein
MEDGELSPEPQPRYKAAESRQRSPPPRRPDPYARPISYHWTTLCNVRTAMMEGYDALYDLHDLAKAGRQVGVRDIQDVLTRMSAMLTCSYCGKIIPKLDNSVFVSKCGHALHKQPFECWNKAGRTCCSCVSAPRR